MQASLLTLLQMERGALALGDEALYHAPLSFFCNGIVIKQVAALPWRRAEDGTLEILLITSRDTGRWVLPKGNIDAGEKERSAALREAAEEAGIWGPIADDPVGTYSYRKRRADGSAPNVLVSVWPLCVASIAEEWPEADERQRAWFTTEDAADAVDEDDLGRLLRKFKG